MTAKTRLRLDDGQALEVMACLAAERPLLLFPSIGEYLAYDDQAEQERGWEPLYAPVSAEGIPVVPAIRCRSRSSGG